MDRSPWRSITVASPRKRHLVKSVTMAEHAHSPVASLGLPSHDTLLVDDDTLFGKMAASFLSSPAPPLEEHAPAAPVGDGNATVPPLPLPLAVDDEDIFGCAKQTLCPSAREKSDCRAVTLHRGLDVDDDLLDFEPTDTTPGAAFVVCTGPVVPSNQLPVVAVSRFLSPTRTYAGPRGVGQTERLPRVASAGAVSSRWPPGTATAAPQLRAGAFLRHI